MSDLSTGNGPWRLLILDPDPADPKWILATVAEPGDVRPASASETELDEVAAAWVRARNGQAHTLTRMPGALCWRVDDAGRVFMA
jgi:hypothetical protein